MNEPAGLYVHVPFCSTKCAYCDFFSVTLDHRIPEWLETLAAEIDLRADGWGRFDSIYIGGGTPSRLSTASLETLFRLLFERFDIDPGSEITVEANPDDVTRDRGRSLVDAGVNRLSLGVQSLRDDELRLLGRRHDAAGALKAVDAIRASRCPQLSLDLIYGLPGQELGQWLETLHRAASLGPDHLSCYELTLDPATPLGRTVAAGALEAKGEEASRSFFLATSTFLEESGYEHYEVSNFARGARHRCRHNMKYWRGAPYLGLGPAAHSYDGQSRFWNCRSLEGHFDAVRHGRIPSGGLEFLTDSDRRLEEIFLGLRTRDGLVLTALGPAGRAEADRICARGLAVVSDGRIVLTREGLVVADAITKSLASDAAGTRPPPRD